MNQNVMKSLLRLTGRSNPILTMLLSAITMYFGNLTMIPTVALSVVILLQVNNVVVVGFVDSMKNLNEDLHLVYSEISGKIKSRKANSKNAVADNAKSDVAPPTEK